MDRTNETATGYTYGGQNYKKETRTDSQGNTYTVDVPTAISTAQLLPTSQVNIPQVPQGADTTGIVSGLIPQADQQVADSEKKVNSISDLLIQSYQNQAAIPGLQSEMEKTAGVADTQKEVLALQNKLRALGAQAQSNVLSEQNKATGQNITGAAVQRNIGDLNRQVAIDSLTTSAMLQAKQGDLSLAQDQIAKAIDLKYKQEENRINILKQAYDVNKELLERYDKKRADALSLKLKQDERDYNEKKANETKVGELITNAASQGAPPALVAKAQAAKTPMEAAAILGAYSGDFLKNELLKEQIKLTKANISEQNLKNIQISNDSKLSLVGNNIAAPNGDTVGLPTNILQNVSRLKLNEQQANAMSFVSRMILSDQNIKNQIKLGYDPTTVVSGIGRTVSSDASRNYQRNGEDFIRAQLRKESGAAIADTELEGGKSLYVAEGFGQDEKDIAATAEKRDSAIRSMIAQSGPAASYLLQYYDQVKSGQGTVSSGNPELDSWYSKTSGAVSNVNSTPVSASSYGFVNNQ